jgi:tryptophan synthase alpha chain
VSGRIERCFEALAQANRPGLIPFFTCGDPSLEAAPELMHAMVEAGADLLEIGVPFSDPQADGPVIQRSSERALARGVGLRDVLEACRLFRERDQSTPLVLMGYMNPIEMFGAQRFAAAAAAAGVDGLLLVDCPPEEALVLRGALDQSGLRLILLAAPTTDDERLAMISAASQGYLYYVSFAGVTGAGLLSIDGVRQRVGTLRQFGKVPVAVGFGVRDATSAAAIGAFADAVVVGSALVETLSDAPDSAAACQRAAAFLAPVRAALDVAR